MGETKNKENKATCKTKINEEISLNHVNLNNNNHLNSRGEEERVSLISLYQFRAYNAIMQREAEQ